MCMCGKPVVNGEEGYRWNSERTSIHPVNAPDLREGDTLLADLPGRCGGSDSHSYHYRLVKSYGGLSLLVRHGGGDERIHYLAGPLEQVLTTMDSTSLYWLLNAIYHAYSDGRREGQSKTAETWRKAAAEKRIKTRKQRGGDGVKVWVESAIV